MHTIINGVSPSGSPQRGEKEPNMSTVNEQGKFANTLKTAIEKVNDAQNFSDNQTQKLANGNVEDLHNVMIAGQKASVMLETSVQIQRKVIDAYNEVMRMQI